MPKSLSAEKSVPQIGQTVLVKPRALRRFTRLLSAQVVYDGLVKKVVILAPCGLQNSKTVMLNWRKKHNNNLVLAKNLR